MSDDAQLVRDALTAATLADARRIQARLAGALGGDTPGRSATGGTTTASWVSPAACDLKLIEQHDQHAGRGTGAVAPCATSVTGPCPTPARTRPTQDLLRQMPDAERADLALVRFAESDGNPVKSKRLTAVFRDKGCGLTPDLVPVTIFQLGGKLKEDRLWQQGAFGLGGATTYRNAAAAVLVTRRDPALLRARRARPHHHRRRRVDGDDQGQRRLLSRRPRVEQARGHRRAVVAARPTLCPEFEPGMHLALISYGVEGIHRQREGDEKSFDTIANTRLFKPVMPVTFRNETSRAPNTRLNAVGQAARQQPRERHPHRRR